jgi:hypothetical protein
MQITPALTKKPANGQVSVDKRQGWGTRNVVHTSLNRDKPLPGPVIAT